MSSKAKLLEKLRHGTINARELRALLRKHGWELKNTVGSHEHWKRGQALYTLATHSKDLRHYMIKQAQGVLLGTDTGEHDEKD
ncbi:MAG: type II toxin-antitoxin system HicA family toxin [Deltaproteobacteria bacterium]|nr:type II toxin-antitoxin system HicA family toxin [Deltaproteobacteria bacterium]